MKELVRKGGNKPGVVTTTMMTFRIDNDLNERLSQTTENKGRWINNAIRKALEQPTDEEKERHRLEQAVLKNLSDLIENINRISFNNEE